jgi:hypothetical protein
VLKAITLGLSVSAIMVNMTIAGVREGTGMHRQLTAAPIAIMRILRAPSFQEQVNQIPGYLWIDFFPNPPLNLVVSDFSGMASRLSS